MKHILPVSTLMLFLASQGLFALSGREIMEKSDQLKKPDSGKSSAMMYIEKAGRTTEKELEITVKKVGGNDRMLISFIRPTRIKLLTHSNKGRDDDQWLQLSSGKVKRIISADKDKPFVNSHLFYEDLEPREIDDYSYTYTGEARAVNADCYKVEAVKKSKNWVYDKTVIYVRKADYFVMRIDIIKNGKLYKYLENYDIKSVSGILTPFKAVMYQGDGKGKTQLVIKSVQYNIALPDAMFAKEALR